MEVKEREGRYTEALDAAYERFRTIELLAPRSVKYAADNLMRSLADIWSHEAEPAPTPDYHQAAMRSWLLPGQTSVLPTEVPPAKAMVVEVVNWGI